MWNGRWQIIKESSFIYDIELKKGNKFFNTFVQENIDQSIIHLYNKLEIFIQELGNNKTRIYKLYEETIDLYKSKKHLIIYYFMF